MYYEMFIQYLLLSGFILVGLYPFLRLWGSMMNYKRVSYDVMGYVRNELEDAVTPMDIVSTFISEARERHAYIQGYRWYFYIILAFIATTILCAFFTGLGFYTSVLVWGYCLGCYMTVAANKNVVFLISWFKEQEQEIRTVESNYLLNRHD